MGDDYGFLSDLTHPNLILVSALHPPDLDFAVSRRISLYEAELLVKICGQGMRMIGHNCQWLIEWSEQHNVPIVLRQAGTSPPATSA